MKLEEQLCSLELAKRLKELGVKQESLFQWAVYETQDGKYLDDDYHVVAKGFRKHDDCRDDYVSAFTVAELGEMLPVGFKSGSNNSDDWFCAVYNQPLAYSTTEADARAKMLIYLIEKGLVKP